jgi:hypothetical protein
LLENRELCLAGSGTDKGVLEKCVLCCGELGETLHWTLAAGRFSPQCQTGRPRRQIKEPTGAGCMVRGLKENLRRWEWTDTTQTPGRRKPVPNRRGSAE